MKRLRIFAVVALIIICMGIIGYVFLLPEEDYAGYMASPTSIQFEKDTLQLGTVTYASKNKVVFRYTNTGNTPLLIHGVHPSCGCTSVEWSKHPVAPGESGEIKAIFRPNSLGAFLKTIEVICNIPESSVRLKLKGNVKE